MHGAEPHAVAVTVIDEDDVGKVPVTWLLTGAAKVEPVALYATTFTFPMPPVTVATGKVTVVVAAPHWYCPL